MLSVHNLEAIEIFLAIWGFRSYLSTFPGIDEAFLSLIMRLLVQYTVCCL